jgi:hypothetical protein
MTNAELIAILRGERLNCKCHAHGASECGSSECGEWPETYVTEAADRIDELTRLSGGLIAALAAHDEIAAHAYQRRLHAMGASDDTN